MPVLRLAKLKRRVSMFPRLTATKEQPQQAGRKQEGHGRLGHLDDVELKVHFQKWRIAIAFRWGKMLAGKRQAGSKAVIAEGWTTIIAY